MRASRVLVWVCACSLATASCTDGDDVGASEPAASDMPPTDGGPTQNMDAGSSPAPTPPGDPSPVGTPVDEVALAIFPSDFVVASPTAEGPQPSPDKRAVRKLREPVQPTPEGDPTPPAPGEPPPPMGNPPPGGPMGPGGPDAFTPESRKALIQRLLAGGALPDCAVNLRSLTEGGRGNPQCYGPNLDYRNHPDGMGGDGQLPSGDLGLWDATEGEQACAAAKLNSLVDAVARRVDVGLVLAASLVCTARATGALEPGEVDADDAGTDGAVPHLEFEGSLDVAADLGAVVAMLNQGATVDRALLERLADTPQGEQTYHYELDVQLPDEVVHVQLMHTSDPATPAEYRGRLWTRTEGARSHAYSVTYSRSERTGRLRYHALSADYDGLARDFFDDSGVLRVDGDWNGGFTRGVFDMDAASGRLGHVSFAWQAGTGDSHSRVFNVFTEAGESGVTGCGFFGYGPRFDRASATLPDSAIDTFICNWAGPGNEHMGRPGLAQKQCMTLSDGRFEPTASHIEYAPVNSCDSSGTAFEFKLQREDTYRTEPRLNELVELASDADFARFMPPVPPPL